MKQKLKEKYLPDSYKHRPLDKLRNFRQGKSGLHISMAC